jgi:hypothetical protein
MEVCEVKALQKLWELALGVMKLVQKFHVVHQLLPNRLSSVWGALRKLAHLVKLSAVSLLLKQACGVSLLLTSAMASPWVSLSWVWWACSETPANS